MLPTFICQVFCSCQSNPRSNDTFNSRIISCKDNGKIVLFTTLKKIFRFLQPLHQTSLATDLCSNFIMRKTSSREEGNFLPSSN
nr:hypothetical protein Iba_chr04aCG8620 [Ipomoea batatas]GMC81855.1 hypothetical protein Iba_chr04bCG7840 [Ipomoea batatas]GMC84163.1 hypothetical protein Iba_chr04cCG8980 [Ipomoea batatas]GMC85932.1 hypothetical protein Iba_chr04dCG6120 [Ipomoea batatas]GMC88508.1 hypothetical protein Iba_chr04eCG10730 [Ipomoea batatas]